jgi:hypothetical protein
VGTSLGARGEMRRAVGAYGRAYPPQAAYLRSLRAPARPLRRHRRGPQGRSAPLRAAAPPTAGPGSGPPTMPVSRGWARLAAALALAALLLAAAAPGARGDGAAASTDAAGAAAPAAAPRPAVVGGLDAPAARLRHQLAFLRGGCGASLLRADVAITARHCSPIAGMVLVAGAGPHRAARGGPLAAAAPGSAAARAPAPPRPPPGRSGAPYPRAPACPQRTDRLVPRPPPPDGPRRAAAHAPAASPPPPPPPPPPPGARASPFSGLDPRDGAATAAVARVLPHPDPEVDAVLVFLGSCFPLTDSIAPIRLATPEGEGPGRAPPLLGATRLRAGAAAPGPPRRGRRAGAVGTPAARAPGRPHCPPPPPPSPRPPSRAVGRAGEHVARQRLGQHVQRRRRRRPERRDGGHAAVRVREARRLRPLLPHRKAHQGDLVRGRARRGRPRRRRGSAAR